MKIKSGFVVRKIADSYMAIPVSVRSADVSGVIALSETGAFLWKLLEKDFSQGELICRLRDEFDVSLEIAERDVKVFLHQLTERGWMDGTVN